MLYKQFKDKKLSMLGLGCMRLPVIDGDDKQIDKIKTQEMIDYAIANGINYFDTAYGYHGGNSEIIVGECLKKHDRTSFYLASKFPGYDLANIKNKEKVFQEQLDKCQVSYFDFYLCHCITDDNLKDYSDDNLGIVNYLVKQKELGKIKHLGFSCHCDLVTLKTFLEKYKDVFEFVQIQLNWFDYEFQNAKEKIKIIASYGLPVWVMEPVRGGRLVNLDQKYIDRLDKIRPGVSTAEWCFRFLQPINEVCVTLSGMSNEIQLKDNIETFKRMMPLSNYEQNVLIEIAREMQEKSFIPCTGCRYCTSKCSKMIPIPEIIKLYNEHNLDDNKTVAKVLLSDIEESKWPNVCLTCRSCERVCPQGIKISEFMKLYSSKIN